MGKDEKTGIWPIKKPELLNDILQKTKSVTFPKEYESSRSS